jgi:glycosyltransferase involved in cell wall biosynthesis
MRVLHFASWYPSEAHDQLGNFVQRHIEAIALNHPSAVVYANPHTHPHIDMTTRAGVLECRAYVKDRKPRAWRVDMALERLVRRQIIPNWGRPDLVHLHVAAEAGDAALRWARRWDVPLVVTEHWTAYHETEGGAFTSKQARRVRRVLGAADRLAPVSQHLAQAMAPFASGTPSQVIPNVVDCDRFQLGAGSPPGGPKKFFHVSSLLEQQKNVFGLLEAFASALDGGLSAELFIAGSGDDTPYRVWAAEHHLVNHIHFLGRLDPTQVAHHMAHSDALVLFSRSENMPCVMVEAWSAGTPVIATDVGGVAEFLTPENGALLPSEDRAALTDIMLNWDPIARDRPAIRRYAEAQFSRPAIAAAYAKLYSSITP